MRSVLKVLGNTALVVGGFFVVLFASSKAASHAQGDLSLHNDIGVGVANADTSSAASYASGGSGDCGSSDSGGGGK